MKSLIIVLLINGNYAALVAGKDNNADNLSLCQSIAAAIEQTSDDAADCIRYSQESGPAPGVKWVD